MYGAIIERLAQIVGVLDNTAGPSHSPLQCIISNVYARELLALNKSAMEITYSRDSLT
jgi:hypothetical protein